MVQERLRGFLRARTALGNQPPRRSAILLLEDILKFSAPRPPQDRHVDFQHRTRDLDHLLELVVAYTASSGNPLKMLRSATADSSSVVSGKIVVIHLPKLGLNFHLTANDYDSSSLTAVTPVRLKLAKLMSPDEPPRPLEVPLLP